LRVELDDAVAHADQLALHPLTISHHERVGAERYAQHQKQQTCPTPCMS
jgi:hypothetical protein